MENKRASMISSSFVAPKTSVPEGTYPHIILEDKYDAIKTLKFDKELTPQQVAFHKEVRKRCQSTNIDFVSLYDTASSTPEIQTLYKKVGYGGLNIPTHGGAGLSHVETMLAIVEAFRLDASFGTEYIVHNGLTMGSIYQLGTDAQKAKFIPQMANYQKFGCFALTEPEFGSDATSLATTATPYNGGWVINGQKRWIGNGTVADYSVVWARNMKTHEVNGFIVEKGTPGLSATKMENKTAIRIVQNANMKFENCFVPEENRLPANGFNASTAKLLEASRATVAYGCAGLLLAAYERAVMYCISRYQFGKKLVSFQLTQEKLMRVLGMVQSTLLTSLHIAKLLDQGECTMKQIALAKATCSKLCREGAAICREVCGGNGLIMDYGVAITFLDAEALYTYEGTYDINTLLAGRMIFGENAIR